MAAKRIKRNLNWRRDSHDHRDHEMKFVFEHNGKVAPLPKIVDLSPGMSPIRDQGQLGSCVGESSNASIEFLERQFGIDPQFEGSPLYAYYNARSTQNKHVDSGAEIRDSIKAMAKLGVSSEKLWPYNVRKVFNQPSAAADADGVTRPISQYLRLTTIEGIRSALHRHSVVLLGFDCYESLESAATAKTGVVPLPKSGEQMIGGHAICLVGYDDNKQLLKFKNSWGTSWGDHGYGYLPYGYVPKHSSDYWVVMK